MDQDSNSAQKISWALRQKLNGFFPGVVGGEQVKARLKAPWRQGLIGLLLLGPVDEGLAGLDGDGAAVDDLHGKEGAATGNVNVVVPAWDGTQGLADSSSSKAAHARQRARMIPSQVG